MVEYYGLSHPQLRIWHVEQSHPGTSMWNNAGTLKIHGKLDLDLLEQAAQSFLRRNESARMRIHLVNGEPKQYIEPFSPIHVDRLDFTSTGVQGLYEWDGRQTQAPMSLLDSPLIYLALAVTGPEEGYLYVKMHHIISDGVSFVVLANEIMETYDCLLSGVEPELQEPVSYLNHVLDEKRYMESARFARDEKYWLDRFSDMPEPTILKSRTTDYFSTKAKRKACLLPAKLSEDVRVACEKYRISVFPLLLSAFAVYLNRVLRQDDIVVSAPVSNRTFAGSGNCFGMYVSTVPIRLQVDGEKTFLEFVEEVSDEWFSILKHQHYPYDLLVQKIHDAHGDATQLYDLSLSYQVGTFEKNKENFSYEGRWHFSEHQASSLNIHWNDREDNGRFVLDYDYLSPLFASKEVDFIHEHLCNIIADAIAHPEKHLFDLDILSSEEKEKILDSFNKTDDGRTPTDLVSLWGGRVGSAPDATALVYHGRERTASEVDHLSNALAWQLAERGVSAGDVVALMLPRSDAYFIGMLAILKAGATFMPVDPAFPADRVEYMVSESKAAFTLRGTGELCGWEGAIPEALDEVVYDEKTLAAYDESRFSTRIDPSGAAYIIYTSGSTGTPKGVVIEHHSIAHFVQVLSGLWHRSPGGRMLCVGPISFDINVMEAAVGLFSSRALVVADEHEADYPDELCNLMASQGVDMMMVTPGRMEMLLSSRSCSQALHPMREIGLGADVLPLELLNRIKAVTKAHITNFYGPTEATIASTCSDVTDVTKVTIGRPIEGAHVYILDLHGNPVPIGVPGELCVGGAGVGRGYVARDELTAGCFIPSPFVSGERLYRTGDLCRWYPRGEIEYLGRIDRQVKIRGYRVELGEIQDRLLQAEGVRSATVICREENGRKYLCAYVVGEDLPSMSELKSWLARALPFYMVPAYILELDEMPLTVSGKVDQRSLPEPWTGQTVTLPPETQTQVKLAEIWKELLNAPAIGKDDHFFEIGGDSLSIVRMIEMVSDAFDVEVCLEDVYREPTLAACAQLIEGAEAVYSKPIRSLSSNRRYYPATPTQEQMLLAGLRDEESVAYNTPALFIFDGILEETRLKKALHGLIERHVALRTSLHLRDGQIMQQVHRDFELPFESISCLDRELEKRAEDLIRPFDTEQAPLMRLFVLHSPQRTALLFDFHHAVCDQIGMQLVLEDFKGLYQGAVSPAPLIDYKDCAVWMQDRLASAAMDAQRTYWNEALGTDLPLLDLPTDYPRTGKRRGGVCTAHVGHEGLSAFRHFVHEQKATFATGVMMAFGLVLSRQAMQEKLVIGMPASGRTRTAMQRSVGAFVNLLPVICSFPEGASVREAFEEINQTLGSAIVHQDYPFARMVTDAGVERDPLRNPLFDVMLSYGNGEPELALGEQRAVGRPIHTGTSKLDLTLFVFETPGGLDCRLEYDAALFSNIRAARMLDRFIYVMKTLFAQPDLLLRDLNVLPPDELALVTERFSDTDQPYEHRLLTSWVEDLAMTRPHDEAVVAVDGRLDFEELDTRADRIAKALIDAGAGEGVLVALLMRRTCNLLPSILGIMKSGAAYVPVDPSYPPERIAFMLGDCGARCLLCDDASLKSSAIDADKFCNVLTVEDILAGEHEKCSHARQSTFNPDAPAYVIYTSGSTGLPKASMLTCRGLANLRAAMGDCIGYEPSWTAVSVTTMSFDIFVADALLPLTYGCRVILADEEELRQPHLLARLLDREGVDFMQTTPSRVQVMVQDDAFVHAAKDLRVLVMAGEKPSIELVRLCKRLMPQARLKNGYGPTEVTVYSAFQEMSDSDHVSIGRPIANTHIYLLDQQRRPVPLGSWAEAYIGGDNVSPGYLGREDLNAERFLPDPFRPGETMYRSGDICRFDETGELFIAGRIDHQVKIRGQRIELGEIQAALVSCDGISEAVVTVWGEEERKQLIAYYVEERVQDPSELRSVLKRTLPVYMVPTRFIRLDRMPMTANGKVDRSQLPDPLSCGQPQEESDRSNRSRSENLTADQKKFLKTVGRVLEVEDVILEDNIFDLGADSLAIISIQSKLIRYGQSLRTQDFYDAATLGDLYRLIGGDDAAAPGEQDQNKDTESTSLLLPERTEVRNILAAATVSLPSVSLEHVVVTGATGFLGSHLVAELISAGARDISCLVRGTDDIDAQRRLDATFASYGIKASAGVHAICADITEDLSFLTSRLAQTTTIFHCAALTEHVGKRSDYERINVQGTSNVISLAETLGAALAHISTVSVCGLGGERFDERCYSTGQNVIFNEYVRSKWISEGLVLDAAERGLSVRIFRIGNLTGRMQDGVFQRNVLHNAFAMRLAAFVELKCCPLGDDGLIEFTPVDLCARAIVLLATRDASSHIHHIQNNHLLSLDDMASLLTASGHHVETVMPQVFSQKAIEHSDAGFDRMFGVIRDIVETQPAASTEVSSDMTCSLLDSQGFSWPKPDERYLALYLANILAAVERSAAREDGRKR